MAKYYYVIISRAVEGQDEEFNDWYDNQHLGDVAKVDGIKSAKRYRLLPDQGTVTPGKPYESLALYELETDDPSSIPGKLKALAGTDAMPMSAALDRSDLVQYMAVAAGSSES